MYLSQDPIGLAGGNPTLYGYVEDVNSRVDVFWSGGKETRSAAEAFANSIGDNILEMTPQEIALEQWTKGMEWQKQNLYGHLLQPILQEVQKELHMYLFMTQITGV
jgi:uncharacterized protein RhaS with RHS repeats